MRRFLTLVCLLGLALPAGISISGCVRNPAGNYCNGLGYGLTDSQVASITLQPQIAGISLAYGQTLQAQSPQAFTCKGASASVASNQISYGTTNNQLVDISPSGNICAGTWNRNTGGGIPNYTYCNYPSPLPTTNGLPYSIAYITATADSVTSNPVTVYIHAPVTSISLVTTSLSSTAPQACLSQNQTAELDAQACFAVNGTQYEFCAPSTVSAANYACPGGLAPGVTSVPSCGSAIGTLSFQTGNASVANINSTTNVITAEQPGTTPITATIAQSASSAGYFSTCPPASVSVSLANGSTKGVVTQGVQQNLTTTVTDTQGNPITGLSLIYESTNPIDITTAGAGQISAIFPGVGSVYAVCEPPNCNPAPINEVGLNGTGLALSSNPVGIIVPGTTSDYVFYSAPGQSQYFGSTELLTGAPGSTVRLPYVPNSMVMDQQGNNLYFGSPHELMIYATGSNSLSKQDPTAPGVVLAASPSASELLINDQVRGLFYLYATSGGATSTFAGMGAAAAWTPDSNTLYVVDSAALGGSHTNTLYVYNVSTGWSTYSLASSGGSQNLAITVPGVGAYMAGDPTVDHTWCPTGTVGNNGSIQFYPQGDSVNATTSVLGATSDGDHILGASLNGASITLADIAVSIPPSPLCPETITGTPPNQVQNLGVPAPLSTNPTLLGLLNLTGVTNATAVNQVVTGAAPTTASVNTAAPVAFVTYSTPSNSTTAAPLPYYLPQAGSVGPFGYVAFSDAASATPPTAPLAGAFSPDNSVFFVSTAGDNEIHYISIPTNVSTSSPPVEIPQNAITPGLPACTPVSAGGNDLGCLYPTAPSATTVVPSTVVTVKPRSVT
jgi:trimeric autotransporter adhesin